MLRHLDDTRIYNEFRSAIKIEILSYSSVYARTITQREHWTVKRNIHIGLSVYSRYFNRLKCRRFILDGGNIFGSENKNSYCYNL